MAEASPEALAQDQKANCIFCKIVKGEIPSRKVFEDEKVLAVLDINPATKGHVLIMPKEHYPILPVIPFPDQQHLFKRTYQVLEKMQQALLCNDITVFIANGGIAGQQSPHFIYHLIPREKGDFLPFEPTGSISKEENDAEGEKIKPRINALMNAYLQEVGRQALALHHAAPVPPTDVPTQAPQEEIPVQQESPSKEIVPDSVEITGMTKEHRLERLVDTINANDDLKDALIHRPEEIKEAIKTNPKFQDLFGDVNVDELSQNLKVMIAQKQKKDALDLDKVGDVL